MDTSGLLLEGLKQIKVVIDERWCLLHGQEDHIGAHLRRDLFVIGIGLIHPYN